MSNIIVHASPYYVVLRSSVQPENDYHNYRESLRFDFWYSCAYCSTTELEATGITFTIDHYMPQNSDSGRALVNDYSNLMWCCDPCNKYKGDTILPARMQNDGFMIFRPDYHDPTHHFSLDEYRILPMSDKIGKLTVELLDLNRLELRKVRELRSRLSKSKERIMLGLRRLDDISIDSLPHQVRSKFLMLRRRIKENGAVWSEELERRLRELNKSDLIDKEDPIDAQSRTDGRRQYLNHLKAIYPDPWSKRQRKKAQEGKRSQARQTKKR